MTLRVEKLTNKIAYIEALNLLSFYACVLKGALNCFTQIVLAAQASFSAQVENHDVSFTPIEQF